MTTPAQTQLFARPRIALERRRDGSLLLRSEDPLGEHERSIAHVVRRQTELHPNRMLWPCRSWRPSMRSATQV